MPRDGNGNYTLPAVYLAATGEVIRATQHNSPLEDVAVALTGSLPRNGSAPMAGNLPMAGNKVTGAADAEVATDLATLGQIIAAMMTREQYYLAELTTYLPMAPLSHAGGTPGVDCKFGDGYLTATKVHRWVKPTSPFLRTVTFEGASGGAGGGTSGPSGGEPSTGPGGAGGAYTIKTFAVADLPDEGVLISGGGGLAGGWDKTVSYPDGPDTQGWITEIGAGHDGGASAFIDAADWTPLGADDAARLVAFNAMSENARISLCILYCSPGKAAPAIDVEENVEGEGGIAYGGDLNRAGNDGGGGAYWSENGIAYGVGGACGARQNNDGLWETSHFGVGGIIGQVAGRGGVPKSWLGNHDGAWGSDWGGGGGGGQATGPGQTGRVIPGGMGGAGGWRVRCDYRV